MTILEYLLYIQENKGVLIGEEAKFPEILEEDIQKMERSHFIEIEYKNGQVESVVLTEKGYKYIMSLY